MSIIFVKRLYKKEKPRRFSLRGAALSLMY